MPISFTLDALRETLLTKQDGHNWRILIQGGDSKGISREPSYVLEVVSKFGDVISQSLSIISIVKMERKKEQVRRNKLAMRFLQ
jgi:hypothetical protein